MKEPDTEKDLIGERLSEEEADTDGDGFINYHEFVKITITK